MPEDQEEAPPAVGAPRREALIDEITTRLRSTCAGWPEELFQALVERVTEITLKYEGRATMSAYDRRSTARLIDDLKEALARNESARDPG